MKIILSETGGGPRQFEILPNEKTVEFLYAMADAFERRAFKAMDEATEHLKGGDIDSALQATQLAKRTNDDYLTLFAFAEKLDNEWGDQLREEEKQAEASAS